MTVKLKTPSNGSVSLTPQDTAADVVLTVPSTAGSFVTANSSGNVGIGVTPSAWTIGAAVQVKSGGFYSGGSEAGLSQNAYYNSGWKYAGTGTATKYETFSGQHIWYTAASGTAGNAISFTQAMTLDASGNLLVGTTDSIAKLVVSGSLPNNLSRFINTNANPDGLLVQYTADPNNTTNNFFHCVSNTFTARLVVRSNGGIANYQANDVNLSDRREKTNFAPAGSYLDKICAIPVQTFNYIDQNLDEDDGLTLGVVAQDVQAVAPELVTESNWGTEAEPKMRLSIYQTDLQYALMKCIQEQQAIINSLQDRITALENA